MLSINLKKVQNKSHKLSSRTNNFLRCLEIHHFHKHTLLKQVSLAKCKNYRYTDQYNRFYNYSHKVCIALEPYFSRFHLDTHKHSLLKYLRYMYYPCNRSQKELYFRLRNSYSQQLNTCMQHISRCTLFLLSKVKRIKYNRITKLDIFLRKKLYYFIIKNTKKNRYLLKQFAQETGFSS